MNHFDNLLDSTLAQTANPIVPTGLEQRLLARLEQAHEDPKLVSILTLSSSKGKNLHFGQPASEANLFTTTARLAAPRSSTSTWSALGLHAVAILLIAFVIAHHVQLSAPQNAQLSVVLAPPPLPPHLAPRKDSIGGGGGQKGPTPVTQGHLPKLATEQILPPKAPPTLAPKLSVQPTVVAQPDLKLAENKMPDLGMPNSSLKGFSLGNGLGTGIGPGTGNGVGPGSGGNTGGGVMHVGGGVRAPIPVLTPDPEYSEEARKAKFSGNVEVYLIVDEQGNPTHVRVVRDVGMGLGEKAVEAVRRYKFKPAVQNGKPVKVDMYVDVNFQIF